MKRTIGLSIAGLFLCLTAAGLPDVFPVGRQQLPKDRRVTQKFLLEHMFPATSKDINPVPAYLKGDVEVFFLVYMDSMPEITVEADSFVRQPFVKAFVHFKGHVFANTITDIQHLVLWLGVEVPSYRTIAWLEVIHDWKRAPEWGGLFVYESGKYVPGAIAEKIWETGFVFTVPGIGVTRALRAKLGNGASMELSHEDGYKLEIHNWPKTAEEAGRQPQLSVSPATYAQQQAQYIQAISQATGAILWKPDYYKNLPPEYRRIIDDRLEGGTLRNTKEVRPPADEAVVPEQETTAPLPPTVGESIPDYDDLEQWLEAWTEKVMDAIARKDTSAIIRYDEEILTKIESLKNIDAETRARLEQLKTLLQQLKKSM